MFRLTLMLYLALPAFEARTATLGSWQRPSVRVACCASAAGGHVVIHAEWLGTVVHPE
jgi:hypothetical protein